MNTADKKNAITACKFLGLRADPRSLASYPSVANCCYGCLPEAVPTLVHQRELCLSEKHKTCPVYLAENPIPMPRELLHKSSPNTDNTYNFWAGILMMGIVAALVVLAILLLPNIFSEQASPVWEAPVPNPSYTLPAPVAKTNTIQVTDIPADATEPIPTAVHTETPPSSATPEPEIVSLPLETILGNNYKVIVHRITAGESLSSLAQAHGTTDKTILDATYKLVIPLGAGNIIVIPLDIDTWQGQPALEPYQISQQLITLDELGQLLGVDAKLLKYYNGCENCAIQQGSWIVIPRAP
jgi:hypothetical protein